MNARLILQRSWHTLAIASVVVLVSACDTVELGEEPIAPASCRPSQAYFEAVLWPEYLAPTCIDAGCHRIDDGRSQLRFAVDPVDDETNYRAAIRFINCGRFDASSLLTRPLEGIGPHGGPDLFGPDDPEFAIFNDWIEAD